MTDRISYRGRRPQTGHEHDRLIAHWNGVPTIALEQARSGTNTECVDCGGEPMGSGLRCVGCYAQVALPKSSRSAHRSVA